MKHKRLFNALAVLFLVTGLFGGFANTPVAVAATGESSAADKIEPALLEKFNLEGTTDFIIRFTEQADLSPAYSMGWDERGDFVYNTLQETAARTQARAKGMLDAAGLEYTTFIAGNDLYVKSGTLTVATSLAELDEVSFIRVTRTYNIDPVKIENPLANVSWSGDLLARKLSSNVGAPSALAWGISDTKADQFWQAFGVQGDGIKVANIDTGVQWDHPALDQAFACPGDPGNANCWSDPENWCGGTACDNNGHGTHTMGTMVADDDPNLTWQAGMAPNATWIACKGCGTSSCTDFALNSCADWILAPGGNSANRPNVVNNSWGGGGGDTWYLAKVNAWVAAGTFPAFSAGNNYTCSSMGSPGDYQESFASASHTSARIISDFSSKGPSPFGHDPYTKPNISAPGSSVCSTVPGGGWSCGYSGTSMASPHSAGAVALLWSCNPSLVGQIDATFQALQNTANTPPAGSCGAPPDGEGNYTYGYGFLDVLAAGTGICGGVSLGTLEGYVFDNNGNPVEGASVMASPAIEQNEIQAITDPTGFYSMDLVVGFYNVTASKQNYTSQTQMNVEVISGTTVTLPDFILTFLGAWTQLDPLPGCPDWTRYDGEYFPADGMVYFLGGRSGTDTFGDIYKLDLTTGTCTDTTANMITGISNYTIVPLNVGGTDVLCTFGGRDPNGANTDDVQCYDPVANTVSLATTLPASIAPFTPASAVGVNNKAYVYGGFRNTASPYETAETWEWDPATNAWTQKGNLVLAMGYIQSVEANGLIYAFGGTVFDGTNLFAQTKTQVFDPVAGTWDDASVAELPTAGAEGRAFFVNGSQIVVAGGGQWPADSPEAYLYDLATDTYDYSFPDLNITRRDHAGVKVPGTPDTLWVFGGRSSATGYGGDSPPYGPPEYYEVEVAEPTIDVSPDFLDEIVLIDTPKTVTLDIMNIGGGVLDWTISEIPGVQEGPHAAIYGRAMDNPGLTASSGTTTLVAPEAPANPEDILWDQPLSGVNQNAYVNQEFSDVPTYSSFLADDFVVADTWTINSIFVPGNGWNGFTTLMNASALTWAIYADNGGVPAGNPGGNPALWSISLPPTDSQVVITNGTGGMPSNTQLNLSTPAVIPAGTYWFVFYPTLPFSGGGQFGRQPADTTNGYWGQFINPGGSFGFGTNWQSWTILGATQQDIAFRLEGTTGGVVDVPWLSENPVSGQNTTPVAVTFDPTGMPVGQYYATLQIDSNDAVNPTVFVPVTMTIVDALPIISIDPPSLASTQIEGEIVTLPLTISNLGNTDLEWLLYENGVNGTVDDFAENFDSYANDSQMHGQGGWKGWFNDPAAGAFVRDDQAHSAPHSVEIAGASDLVHEYSGYTTGSWTYTAWQYIPAPLSMSTYFILLNSYDDAGSNLNWSLEMQFDPATNTVINDGPDGGTLPIIYDQWVELRVEIDLDANTQSVFYGGDLLFSGSWTEGMSGGGVLNIAAVDLYAGSGASAIYYDDISLAAPTAVTCDLPGDIPWLSVAPDSGITPPGGSDLVDVTFDATGMAPGVYSDFLCASSNDPVNPIVAVPVELTVEAAVAGVLLTPATDAGAGDPGTVVEYTLVLENTGNLADTITVDATGTWAVTLPVSSFDLGPGETANVVVQVTVPAGALAGDSDVTTVEATSTNDPAESDSSALTTTANQVFGIELTPATAAQSGAPGDVVTYNLTLVNTGNGQDTVTLAFAGNLWNVQLPVASFTLAAGESVAVTVLVTIPADAVDGATDMVTVTATSEGGPTASSELTTTAVIVPPEGFVTFLPIQFKH